MTPGTPPHAIAQYAASFLTPDGTRPHLLLVPADWYGIVVAVEHLVAEQDGALTVRTILDHDVNWQKSAR